MPSKRGEGGVPAAQGHAADGHLVRAQHLVVCSTPDPLSSEYGIHKCVKARFWPWLDSGLGFQVVGFRVYDVGCRVYGCRA